MKYSFNNIIGNEQIKTVLIKSAADKKMSHAYIFEGGEGTGKTLLANCFSKLIFCNTNAPECGCHSCIQFEAGSHSDLFYITCGEKKSIGVSAVRDVIAELSKKPFEYDNKIFIIEEAQALTAEAQNALLRSIEEPPDYAVFILLTDSINKILDTVRSRCFYYKMKLFGNDEIYTHLKSLGFSDEQSKIACGYSDGSIGRAISICENEYFFDIRKTVNYVLADCGGGLASLFEGMRRLEDYKDHKSVSDDFLALALLWFRDVLVYKATGVIERVYQTDYMDQIIKCAGRFSFKQIYLNINGLTELKRGLSANTPFAMALDAFTIKLGENR